MTDPMTAVLDPSLIGAFVAVALFWFTVFWRVRRRRRLEERYRELIELADREIVATGDADSLAPASPSTDAELAEFRTRIVLLETRMSDLRRDFDLAGRLRRRISDRPVLAAIIGFGATVLAGVTAQVLGHVAVDFVKTW